MLRTGQQRSEPDANNKRDKFIFGWNRFIPFVLVLAKKQRLKKQSYSHSIVNEHEKAFIFNAVITGV